MSTTTDRAREITGRRSFQVAVSRAMGGDLAGLHLMDDEELLVAARSMSVLIAAHLVCSAPCTLAGFAFWHDSGALTFCQETPDARVHLLPVTAAQMVALDATALINRDHGVATNDAWAALLAAVPTSARRRLAFLLAGKFTAAPETADPIRLLGEDTL